MKKKSILFVMNTMGRGGAETALIELLRRIDKEEYAVSLFVLTGQGEMLSQIPEGVKLINKKIDTNSVLDAEGRKHLTKTVVRAFIKDGNGIKLMPYIARNGIKMVKNRRILPDKLLWRALSDGAPRPKKKYDLAISYLEGAAAYYVADHVEADRKVAFIHTQYDIAGYTRDIDQDCYLKFDRIFGVSDEAASVFKKVYPELEERIGVFHNLLNNDLIIEKSEYEGGFDDDFDGTRLLTVGRLVEAKALEVSIKACRILKDKGYNIRWYVLGEGNQRKKLEAYIAKLGLEKDFLLLGTTDNPYPYIKQADLYVHCSRYEGKSMAVQEAQILGKPIIASDCNGNKEQVIHDVDGIICKCDSGQLVKAIKDLLNNKEKCDRLAHNAAEKNKNNGEELNRLLKI